MKKEEMDEIAESYIKKIQVNIDIDLLIIYDATIKKPYGNIYSYNSERLIKSGDELYALAGNAPFLVEKETGKIIVFGSAHTRNYYIQEYEAGRWPNNRRLD